MLNHKEKDIVLSALDIVIDGVSSSEANEEMRTAGVYIAGLIIADTKGMLGQDTRKAILSIIEMYQSLDSRLLLIRVYSPLLVAFHQAPRIFPNSCLFK